MAISLCNKGLIKAREARCKVIEDIPEIRGLQVPEELDEKSMAAAIEAYLRHREDSCPGLLLDICESYRSFKATWLLASEDHWSFHAVMAMMFLGSAAILTMLLALAVRSIALILG